MATTTNNRRGRTTQNRGKTVGVNVGGKTKIVKKGSNAYNKYIGQGGKVTDRASLKSAEQALRATGTARNRARNNPEVLAAEDIGTPAMNLPSPVQPQDTGNMVGTNNAGLLGGLDGYSVDQNGQFVAPQAPTGAGASADNSYGGMENLFKSYMGEYGKITPPSTEDIYAQTEKELGLKKKRQAVSDYTSQLNTITANAQAEALKLEGQGRGITESIIGGQQAQINREAAIQALPVQAQLAAAQGNLEIAEQHLDTMFKLKAQDAQTQFQTRTNILNSVFDFATKKEQFRLDELKLKEQRTYDETQKGYGELSDWSKFAIQNGQASLVTSLSKLDPKSPTFRQDLAKIQAKMGGGTGDRLLTLSEATEQGVPYGTKLSEMLGKNLGGNKLSIEADKAYNDTIEAKSLTAIQGQVQQLDTFFKNKVGTSDRKMGDEKWTSISKDSSAVRLIANAEARALNPDLARRADENDQSAVEGLGNQADQAYKKYFGGSAGNVTNLKSAVRVIDSSYEARVNAAKVAKQRIQQLYPSSATLNRYTDVNGSSVRQKLEQASKVGGFQPVQILDYLKNDPILGSQINSSLNAGYTHLQIYEYLMKQ